MAKPEDQLAIIRKRMEEIPRNERAAFAVFAGVSQRTIQHVARGTKTANYDTVYKIYSALEKRVAKKPRKVKVEVL